MSRATDPAMELVKRCGGGDRQAFTELFHRYRSYAYNLIYKITGPQGNHEDLLQDVFFQLFLSMKTFKENSSFKTWFHRLVINVCSREFRYSTAQKRHSSEVSFDDTGHEHVPSPGVLQDRTYELKQMVEDGLQVLDYQLRIVLVLQIYGELELEEIAAIVKIPEGTVKSRLFAARKAMKLYFDGIER